MNNIGNHDLFLAGRIKQGVREIKINSRIIT